MNSNILPENTFDVIALEAKLQADFERSRSEEDYSRLYTDKLRDTFIDGEYDALIDIEPEAYQWASLDYRKGYLAGVTSRFDELFAE